MEVPEYHRCDWTSLVYQLRWLAYLSVTNPMLFWNSCWVKSNSRCVANVFITADSRFRARTSTRTLAERHWSLLDKCDIICIEQGRLTQIKVTHWMDVLETYFCGIFTVKISDKWTKIIHRSLLRSKQNILLKIYLINNCSWQGPNVIHYMYQIFTFKKQELADSSYGSFTHLTFHTASHNG